MNEESGMKLFHCICDETRDWMLEKMENLDMSKLGHNLKTS